MLLELLSLMFYIYYWMMWLKNEGMLPDIEEIRKEMTQNTADE